MSLTVAPPDDENFVCKICKGEQPPADEEDFDEFQSKEID